ncbi:MAG: hypothetical protein AABX33_07200 [Nanoarchaeota archaeon]
MSLKEWFRSKPLWLRGGITGVILGIFWSLTAIIGGFVCNWNPVDGSSIFPGFCKNTIALFIFYFPFVGAFYLTAFGLGTVLRFLPIFFSYFIIVPIILISFCFLVGSVVGWIVGKIRARK